jgi:hypothetical protein
MLPRLSHVPFSAKQLQSTYDIVDIRLQGNLGEIFSFGSGSHSGNIIKPMIKPLLLEFLLLTSMASCLRILVIGTREAVKLLIEY